jgi:hypothetical protein
MPVSPLIRPKSRTLWTGSSFSSCAGSTSWIGARVAIQ